MSERRSFRAGVTRACWAIGKVARMRGGFVKSKTLPSSSDRRRFLEHTWSTVFAGVGLALLPGNAAARRRFRDNPFSLGVASGDPTPDGVVLWTRLAPDPTATTLDAVPCAVGWRIASDGEMRHVVQRGRALAAAELAHSVHVEIEGLLPGRNYFYQFDAGSSEESAIGPWLTARSPRAAAKTNRRR
jgi:alkaline phosphatase D